MCTSVFCASRGSNLKFQMLRVGIIGMSAGNAHPYSWSSIINGKYDGKEITTIGYQGVTTYLDANKDTLGLPEARVTHVLTQDISISKSIAASSGIESIAERAEDMIGKVDAVILARDDAEFHVEMAKPFIEAGVSVFIDKPLAIKQEDLNWFEEQHAAGKFIMSCSSMRYANECRVVKQDIASLGRLELVTAVGKKDWLKYGVHMIEAMFATLMIPKWLLFSMLAKRAKMWCILPLKTVCLQPFTYLWRSPALSS